MPGTFAKKLHDRHRTLRVLQNAIIASRLSKHGLADLRSRSCMQPSATTHEQLIEHVYYWLHPWIAALGVLFVVVVLAGGA